jgi:hypothetical protein
MRIVLISRLKLAGAKRVPARPHERTRYGFEHGRTGAKAYVLPTAR